MNLKKLIKLFLSVAMLAVVASMVDPEKLWSTITTIPLYVCVVITFGYVAGQVLSSYKWWRIGKAGGVDVPYTTALRAYFIGMFVNSFGFGIVGGDVARGVLLGHSQGVKAKGIASVIADRAHGLAVLACMGAMAALILPTENLEPYLVYLLCAIGLGITAGWFIGPWFVERFFPEENKFARKIHQMSEMFPRSPKDILYISLLSVVFHLLQILLHSVMASGLGLNIGWSLLLIAIPFVNILSSLPIAWNGLGVRETAYVFFLGAVMEQQHAIAFGAIWLLAITITSAIGGIVAVSTGNASALLKGDQKLNLEPQRS